MQDVLLGMERNEAKAELMALLCVHVVEFLSFPVQHSALGPGAKDIRCTLGIHNF